MYILKIELDFDILNNIGKIDIIKAQAQIKYTLKEHGFISAGTVYFGNNTSNAVKCFSVISILEEKYDWFIQSAKTIKMFKVTDEEDLLAFFTKY